MTTLNSIRIGLKKPVFLMLAMGLIVFFVNTLLGRHSAELTASMLDEGTLTFLKYTGVLSRLILVLIFVIFYRYDRLKYFFYTAGIAFSLFYAVVGSISYFSGDLTPANWLLLGAEYMVAQQWMFIMYPSLFWIAANQRFSTSQAAIAYPIVLIVLYFSSFMRYLFMTPEGELFATHWHVTTPAIAALGALLIVYFSKIFFQDMESEAPQDVYISISLREKVIYIGLLAMIFIAGSFVGNVLEIASKQSALAAFPDKDTYLKFVQATKYFRPLIGIVMGLLTCWIVWAFGWCKSALVAPVMVCLMVAVFWFSQIDTSYLATLTALLVDPSINHVPSILLLLFSNVFKGLFFLLIMSRLQIAFIPLPASTKARANAIFAGLSIGNAGSAFFIANFYIILGVFSDIKMFMGSFIITGLGIWIVAILALGHYYNSLEERGRTAQAL